MLDTVFGWQAWASVLVLPYLIGHTDVWDLKKVTVSNSSIRYTHLLNLGFDGYSPTVQNLFDSSALTDLLLSLFNLDI